MIEDVTLEKEKEIHLSSHEILLSFVNDSGAEKFEEWWFNNGIESFNKYCENNNT